MTKQDHKVRVFFSLVRSGHVLNVLVQLTDYDRFNNSLTKFCDKKTLSDEGEEPTWSTTQLEQDSEIAKAEIHDPGRTVIDPLFDSFHYSELNIYFFNHSLQ